MAWQFLKASLAYVSEGIHPTSLIQASLVAITMGTLLFLAFMSLKVNPAYSWGFLAVFPLAAVDVVVYRKVMTQRLRNRLREEWGKETSRTRILATIGNLHQFRVAELDESADPVDDQTWNDLNMNEVYSRMDRTLTNPGESVLYDILRTPLSSEDRLQRRDRIISLFQNDRTVRERIRLELCRLGRWDTNVIASLIWNPMPPSAATRHVYSLLALLALVSAVGAPLLWGMRGIAVIVVVYVINLVVSYRDRARLSFEIAAMRYQSAMIRTAARIASLEYPALADDGARWRQASSATRSIARKTSLLLPEGTSSGDVATLLYSHLDTYFLRSVRMHQAVLEEMSRHRDELKTIYLSIGELDALQSIASYRDGLPAYVRPNFVETGTQLRIHEARHPLLDDCVANSIDIRGSGVTITGSNMAGKTTFLRVLGVNALLAQTACTCMARAYTASLFRIFSSINDGDNLLEGKSYYLVQAEHLLRMVRSSEKPGRTLCLIDEPLAGTNSSERKAASAEILRYLAGHNATVILATHDLELAKSLEGVLANYCFTGQVTDQGVSFDF